MPPLLSPRTASWWDGSNSIDGTPYTFYREQRRASVTSSSEAAALATRAIRSKAMKERNNLIAFNDG
jgi:hypothetical protein